MIARQAARSSHPTLILAALLALASAACGDTLEDIAEGGGGDGDDAFSRIYASDQFQKCSGCHAPNADGKTEGTESTQDWSTRDSAHSSLKGEASGLIGNFAGCNGVPLLGPSAEASLLVAVFDEELRANFMSADTPDCNGDAISDMTLKIGGPLPGSLLTQLKAWVDSGAP